MPDDFTNNFSDLSLYVVERSDVNRRLQNGDQIMPGKYAAHLSVFSRVSLQWMELFALRPQSRYDDNRRAQTKLHLLLMTGDVYPNPDPATDYPCPVCTSNVPIRGFSYQCNICYSVFIIGPETPSRSHRPISRKHLHPLIHLENKLAMLARSTAPRLWKWKQAAVTGNNNGKKQGRNGGIKYNI